MLGRRQRFAAVPFFWSQHYDIPIDYVGHAEAWDELAIDGDIVDKDCLPRLKRSGRVAKSIGGGRTGNTLVTPPTLG